MTVTAIRLVNNDLPHSDIYLDDLWEIEDLFTSAYQRLGGQPTVTFSYQTDNFEITTREELTEYGGKSCNFTLKVTKGRTLDSWTNTVLSFHGRISPQLNIPSPLRDSAWDLQGRVQAIFNERRKVYKESITRMSPLLIWILSFFDLLRDKRVLEAGRNTSCVSRLAWILLVWP